MFAGNDMVRAGNAMMRQRILTTPAQPYRDGQPAYRVIEAPGRRSGALRQTPLAVFQHAGQRYLIAPTRQRDWVANLVAAGRCAALAHGVREEYTAVPTDDDAALAAAQAYRNRIGDGMSSEQFPFAAGASLAEIRQQLPAMAVFRLIAQP